VGATGAKGDKGDPGPQGPAGLVNVVLVYGSTSALPTGVLSPHVWVVATCPDGSLAVGGGASVAPAGPYVVQDAPYVDAGASGATGWSAYVQTASGGTLPRSAQISVTGYAMCAQLDR
jgi:hypothetical protein